MKRLAVAAVVALLALLLIAEATRLISTWDRQGQDFDRQTRELIEEDIRLTTAAREAEARGDQEAARRLRAERERLAERLHDRVRKLGGGD
jgi:hypothetical protein